ncbi:SDR family oxidoreductase [Aeromicrobium wangtongii]|uniref:SDR family oxidoreductase n=1 Tax=Aeromicrobium wangtongii TaxID=2969247 RepID=A0ABY5M6N4_9ACTN|nr:SDR family oxidoreductase [Aeromicrobium wangtongii]MCD9198600.1 SDR family oxidoreductase [Aeromicrobium wangtongii]UUP12625.1 SDR family oxidoreductase [Aeromicrobium wangtongii]
MKNVVITGSTKGVGFALAREFRRLGHSVVITGRTAEAVDSAVTTLTSGPGTGRVIGHALDVTDPDAVAALWDHAAAKLGTIDLWINNAGVAHTTAPIIETSPQDVRAMVTTNMYGTIFGSQVAVRGMIAQGSGQVFNVLGGGSDGKIRPNMGVYGATKRGLDMFTAALVKEVKGTGVRVGQVRPGILITDGWRREAATAPDQVASQRKMLNILADHAEDVAPVLVDRMLSSTKNGDAIAWLTTGKITKRFMTPGYAKKHDVLGRYGL